MLIVGHGVTLAALFLLVAALEERVHTRDLGALHGLWSAMPRLGAITLLFALALMGLPGLGTFVGEVLLLLGTFQMSAPFGIVAALGMIAAVIYALWLAILCAEAVPWRCHRSLVSDALLARGVRVQDILGPGATRPHELTRFAQVQGQQARYPGAGAPS